MQNFVNLAISKWNQYSEPREINNDVEGSDFDIVSLSFIRHGLMFANTNVGSRMLYNCILAGWQPPGWRRKEMELQDGIAGRRRFFQCKKCPLHQNVKIKRKSPMAW